MTKAALPSILVPVVLLAVAVIAEAQQPTKVLRIGYLSSVDSASESTRAEPFRLGLRELGYIEGQNIAIEYRYGKGKNDRLPELAAELVHRKVDIILVSGDRGILAAKNATTTIPIVMTGGGSNPVEAGLVESLARPGGNVTGITNLVRELGGKRLELFKEAVPKLARVAVLYEPGNPGQVREVKEVLPVARVLGLTVRSWEVRGADDSSSTWMETQERVFLLAHWDADWLHTSFPPQEWPWSERRIDPSCIEKRQAFSLS
jgi:putative ABC transport system substrate-binding protein